MNKKAIAVLGVAAFVVACAAAGEKLYDNNDLELITAYTAKETCSCLYVMEMNETYCRAWTKANPAVASWTANNTARSVTASALFFWSASASYVNDDVGCVLDR